MRPKTKNTIRREKRLLRRQQKELEKEELAGGGERKTRWSDLPDDVWLRILSKLTTVDLLVWVQRVCSRFRRLCKTEPSLFRTLDLCLDPSIDLPFRLSNLDHLVFTALTRSVSGFTEAYLEYPTCDESLLIFLAKRSRKLKHLRIKDKYEISEKGMIEALRNLPMLEELQIIGCRLLSEKVIEFMDQTICPFLKSFTWTGRRYWPNDYDYCENDHSALAIAKSMPQIIHLALMRTGITNLGLKAILDGCPHLQSLDLRGCQHIDITGDLEVQCKLRRVEHLCLPQESISHYWFPDDGTSYCDSYWYDGPYFHNYRREVSTFDGWDSDDSDYSDNSCYTKYYGFYDDVIDRMIN